MKKFLLTFICLALSITSAFADDTKKDIIAVYNSNNIEEAFKMINNIPEKKRDYEHWYLLGNLSQDLNSDENAILFFKKSISLKPEFDKAHYNLGNIYLKQNKLNSAVNEYKLAIKSKKDYPFYYYNLGCAYLGLKNYKDAKSAFKKAVSLKGDEPDFYYNLALVNKELNKPKDAQKALDMYNKLYTEEDL